MKVRMYLLKPITGITALIVLMISAVLVSQAPAEEAVTKRELSKPLRYVKNDAYGFGEHLRYKVGYKFITAGIASFTVAPEPLIFKGAECYDIRFEVRSLKSLDWLYRVRDRYRTVMDIHGIYPLHFEQRIREGNYKRDFYATLDQSALKATTKDGQFDLKPFTHDIVSAFYYVRTMDLQSMHKGDTLHLTNFYKKKTYDLKVKILGRQTVKVEAGTFRCVVIEPLVVEGGLFKNEGKIVVWLSDDERKIPVKVRTKVVIGAIDAELISYEGLRGPLVAKVEDRD